MTSKFSPKSKRPAAASILDQKKLLAFRERAGLTLHKVQELSGISKSSLSDFEHGRIVPQLHQFKKLCEVYHLDIFEIMELLCFNFMGKRDLKNFRTACQNEGETPAEALRSFIIVYAYQTDSESAE
jgi:transcriptional regulator with XRE-family HTH domain